VRKKTSAISRITARYKNAKIVRTLARIFATIRDSQLSKKIFKIKTRDISLIISQLIVLKMQVNVELDLKK
jgi:hypothetical protein